MRRGSVVAPILLIVIGGLFLLNNLRPDLSLLSILGTYWPFLFVIWGALRLVEILSLRFRGAPLPSSGLSGGEWALAVLLFFVGSGLTFSQKVVSGWPDGIISLRGLEVFGEAYDYPVQTSHAAVETPHIVIENLRGNVRVSVGSGDQIQVTGRKTIRSLERSTADSADKQTPVQIDESDGIYVIRTNQASASSSARVSTDLDISVPAGASIETRGRNGDYDITGIKGAVDIVSDNAGVRIQDVGSFVRVDLRRSDIIRLMNVAGNVDIKGTGDDVELEDIGGAVVVNGSYSGSLSFRNLKKQLTFTSSNTELSAASVPGQIRFDLGDLTASDVTGPFRLKSRTKDVQLTDITSAVEIDLDRGDIEVRQAKVPMPRMRLVTRSGDLELALPEKATFQLTATTDHGELDNSFGPAFREETEHGGGTISGRAGTGEGPQLEASTRRGSVVVRGLTGILPAPPAPPGSPTAPEPLQLQHH